MKTRTSKAIGVVVGVGAIALSVPLAVSAYAEPTTTPVAEIPDPQGSSCDAFKTAVPNFKSLANVPVSNAQRLCRQYSHIKAIGTDFMTPP